MPILKNRRYLLFTFVPLLTLVVISGSGTVFAQGFCGVQVGNVSISNPYFYQSNYYENSIPWNVQLTVPISAVCPAVDAHLLAVGTVYDTVTNTVIGSAALPLILEPGQTMYSSDNAGVLVFSLYPASVIQYPLQVQISVYSTDSSGQYTSVVATITLPVTSQPVP